MSGRIALELTSTALRGVVVSAWRVAVQRTFDVPWDPQHPEAGLQALRAAIPDPDGVWVSVGLDLLHVTPVDLPPAPDDAREAMVALEPDRFFATNDPVRVGLAPGAQVAFAADAAWLDGVLKMLGDWTTVQRVEPAPVAAAAMYPTDGEHPISGGMVTVRQGRVVTIRRTNSAATGNPPTSALGALHRADAALIGTLLNASERRQAVARTTRSIATAVLGAVAAIVFCLFSIESARERTLLALTVEAERLMQEVRPALDAQQQLVLRQRDAELARAVATARPDPAAALAAVSALLPRDAVVLNARVAGHAWQIDGTSADAAALIRLLDADDRLDNVRSLAASSRFRDGRTTRESFSIAFDVRSSP